MTDFDIRCSMKEKRYSKECAEDVLKSLSKSLLSNSVHTITFL